MMEDNPQVRQDSRSSSPGLSARVEESSEASLRSILNEVRDFRRDNKVQLTDIKHECIELWLQSRAAHSQNPDR